MNFTAIDFETANRRSDSACQLAAVVVREGEIVDSAMWMIRPEPFFFSAMNIGVHGITPARVEREPLFGEHWPAVSSFLRRSGSDAYDCLVAHNASFDLGVLFGSLQSHRIAAPELTYTCTRLIARQTWPGRARYGLKPLADWLGVRFRHHDALEDSIACAKILIAAGNERCAHSLEELEGSLQLSRGAAGEWGRRAPTRIRRARAGAKKRAKSPSPPNDATPARSLQRVAEPPGTYRSTTESSGAAIDLQRLLVRAGFIRSLQDHRVVFTGVLQKLSRSDAVSLAVCLGGGCQEIVNRETTVLVVGHADEKTQRAGRTTSIEEETAERLQSQGHPIRVLTEDEFLALVIAPDRLSRVAESRVTGTSGVGWSD